MPADYGDENIILGRNPVREALRAGRPINKILLSGGDNSPPLRDLARFAREAGIPVQQVERLKLDKLAGGLHHQGVIAFASIRHYWEVDHILEQAGDNPFLLILDEINDPHNLGAIIRSADAAGAHGVVIPKRRSAALTPAVSRASAGAVEYVPVARVTNIVQTIEALKEKGIWIVGAHMEGQLYWEAALGGPLALVIGGEEKGLGRLVMEKCDLLVSLPMLGRVGSLNASVAAALLSYEVLRQRGRAQYERLSHRGRL
jgi:23S rRNA (guanosine2251-2'-O)-methyltransferase